MTFLHRSASFHPRTHDHLSELGLDPYKLSQDIPTVIYEVQPHSVFILKFNTADVRVYQEHSDLFVRHAVLVDPEQRKHEHDQLLKEILDLDAPRVNDDISSRTTVFLHDKTVVTHSGGPIAIIPHNPDVASAAASANKHKQSVMTTSRHPYAQMSLSDMLKQGFTLTPLEFPYCAVDDPDSSRHTMHVINVRDHTV